MKNKNNNEDICEARRCFDDGEEFCAVCDGWYCLNHLTLIVGNDDTPAYYVCGVCLDDATNNQATL